MDNTQNGESRFGRLNHQAAILEQNKNPSTDKADLIVVCSPTRLSDRTVASWDSVSENIETAILDYPVTDRIYRLLQTVKADPKTLAIFEKHSGVPVAIADRVAVSDCDIKVLTYTVNKSPTQIHSLLSAALTPHHANIETLMDQHGIVGIFAVDKNKSVNVIRQLIQELTTLTGDLLPFTKVPDETLYEETVNLSTLPALPVVTYSGTRASFIIINGRGEMFATASKETKMEYNKEQAYEQAVVTAMELGIPTAGRTLEDILADIAEQSNVEEFDDQISDVSLGDSIVETIAAFSLPRYVYRALAQAFGLAVEKKTDLDIILGALAEYLDEAGKTESQVVAKLEELAIARNVDVSAIEEYFADTDESEEPDLGSDVAGEISDIYEPEDDIDVETPAPESDGDEVMETLTELFSAPGVELTNEERIERLEAIGLSCDGKNIVQILRMYNEQRTALLAEFSAQEDPVDADDEGINEDLDEDEPQDDSESEIRATLESMDTDRLEGLTDFFDIDEIEHDNEDDKRAYLIDSIVEQLTAEVLVEISEDLDVTSEDFEELMDALDADEQDEEAYYADVLAAATLLFQLVDAEAEIELETQLNDDALIESERTSTLGSLMRLKSAGSLVINFVLVRDEQFDDHLTQLSDVDGTNYRFPFYLGEESVGSMAAPANALMRCIHSALSPNMLIERERFESRSYSRQMTALLNNELQESLYSHVLEDGLDPSVFGIQLGDFEDEESEADDGVMIPMADLFTAQASTRVLNDTTISQLLTTGVLNIVVPGFWAISDLEQVSRMIEKARNTVISTLADRSNLEIHTAFTFNTGDLMHSEHLYEAFNALRETEQATIFTAADAYAVDNTVNVLEYIAGLDRSNVPMTVLASGIASFLFEMGGDTTIVVPCFEVGEDDEDDLEDEQDWEEDEAEDEIESEDESDDDSEDEDETDEDGDDDEDETDDEDGDDIDVESDDESEDEDETEEDDGDEDDIEVEDDGMPVPTTADEFLEVVEDDYEECDLSQMPRSEMRSVVITLGLIENKREAKALSGNQLREMLEDYLSGADSDDE